MEWLGARFGKFDCGRDLSHCKGLSSCEIVNDSKKTKYLLTSDFEDGKIHPIIKIIQSLFRVGGGTWSLDPTATSSDRKVLIPAGERFWPGR